MSSHTVTWRRWGPDRFHLFRTSFLGRLPDGVKFTAGSGLWFAVCQVDDVFVIIRGITRGNQQLAQHRYVCTHNKVWQGYFRGEDTDDPYRDTDVIDMQLLIDTQKEILFHEMFWAAVQEWPQSVTR